MSYQVCLEPVGSDINVLVHEIGPEKTKKAVNIWGADVVVRSGYVNTVGSNDELKRYLAEKILNDLYASLPAWARNQSKDAIPIAEWVIDNDLLEPVVGYDIHDGSQKVVGSFLFVWLELKAGIWAKWG